MNIHFWTKTKTITASLVQSVIIGGMLSIVSVVGVNANAFDRDQMKNNHEVTPERL